MRLSHALWLAVCAGQQAGHGGDVHGAQRQAGAGSGFLRGKVRAHIQRGQPGAARAVDVAPAVVADHDAARRARLGSNAPGRASGGVAFYAFWGAGPVEPRSTSVACSSRLLMGTPFIRLDRA